MKIKSHTSIAFAMLLSGAMLLAACAPAASAPTPTAVPPTSVPTVAPSSAPVAESIQVATDPKLGQYLTDAKGMTLYVYKNDTSGVSNCTGACAQAWPPFVVSSLPTVAQGVTGTLSLITRSDGTQQVAINGRPLYFFASDKKPGDINGEGFKGIWNAVTPAGDPIPAPAAATPEATSTSASGGYGYGNSASPTEAATAASSEAIQVATSASIGKYLTDARGMTLYIFKSDSQGVSNCSGGCAQIWPPFVASSAPTAGAGVTGKIGLITRADGSQQVTYNGMPLYFYQGDTKAGDINGQGLNNLWFAATP
jgi:predicted lipoprotein with Yx(FWY)xxD motif